MITKEEWDQLKQSKEDELQELTILQQCNDEEFEARCIAEAKKYKTKKETMIENILNSPRSEFAEILVTIEYGKRPRK